MAGMVAGDVLADLADTDNSDLASNRFDGGGAMADPVGLAEEQKFFDHAADCREREREVLKRAPHAGATKGAVSGLARWVKDHPLAQPGSAIAVGSAVRDEGTRFYVGREAIFDGSDAIVMSWKAPAASPYFEATATDPLGLLSKRNYQLDDNQILDFDDLVFADLDARIRDLDEPTIDDALLRDLERTRTGEMRDIVETIQAAQHQLLRADLASLLVVQGGPGTGKTAVALHRVSWLLYNERDTLTDDEVLVVGPSRAFVRYIKTLLPSLGDGDVVQQPIGALGPASRNGRQETAELAAMKGELRMQRLLRRAMRDRIGFDGDELPVRVGIRIESVPAAEVEDRVALAHDASYSVGRTQFREWLRTRVDPLGRAGSDFHNVLDNAVDRVYPQLTAQSFLRDLYGSEGRLLRAALDDFSAREVQLLYRKAADRLGDETWTDADIAVLDHADHLINGGPDRQYSHIVVDEAQDLSPMQLASIARRSRNGSMTVLGDIAQSYGPFARDSWDEIVDALRTTVPVRIETLRYGYRVPQQIFAVAARLLRAIAPEIEAPNVVRSGPADPELLVVEPEQRRTATLDAIQTHSASGLSVGVIVPVRLFEKVGEALSEAGIAWRDVRVDGQGGSINLLRATDARGLEFDATVVVEPNEIRDEVTAGGRLLYVALTRATHRLTVISTTPIDDLMGIEPTAVLPDEIATEAAATETVDPDAAPNTEPVGTDLEPIVDLTDARSHGASQAAEPRAPKPELGRLGTRLAVEIADEIAGAIRPEVWDDLIDVLIDELAARRPRRSEESE